MVRVEESVLTTALDTYRLWLGVKNSQLAGAGRHLQRFDFRSFTRRNVEICRQGFGQASTSSGIRQELRSFVPQGGQRIDAGRPPRRSVAGRQRRGQQNRGCHRYRAGIIRFRLEQK